MLVSASSNTYIEPNFGDIVLRDSISWSMRDDLSEPALEGDQFTPGVGLSKAAHDFDRQSLCPSGKRLRWRWWRRRADEPQAVLVVDGHDEARLAREIESVKVICFGLENHHAVLHGAQIRGRPRRLLEQ